MKWGVCGGGGGGRHFYQVSRWSLHGHTGVLGSGHSPLVQAHGAGQGCFPVLPLDRCDMHFRPDPGALPQDHPGSGVVAPWPPPGQLHGNSSTSPSSPCRPVCCVCFWGFHSWCMSVCACGTGHFFVHSFSPCEDLCPKSEAGDELETQCDISRWHIHSVWTQTHDRR